MVTKYSYDLVSASLILTSDWLCYWRLSSTTEFTNWFTSTSTQIYSCAVHWSNCTKKIMAPWTGFPLKC